MNKNNKIGIDYNNVIYYDIPEKVRIRKHSIDVLEFQEFMKKNRVISIKKISKLLDIPISEVQHWYRKDKYFSFPNEKIWFKLKEILSINENKYDAYITEWIEMDSVHEQSNRVYDFNGISPTLTSTSADLRILIY